MTMHLLRRARHTATETLIFRTLDLYDQLGQSTYSPLQHLLHPRRHPIRIGVYRIMVAVRMRMRMLVKGINGRRRRRKMYMYRPAQFALAARPEPRGGVVCQSTDGRKLSLAIS
jgi:hypothetical protein